ncbi:hypothetical protein BDW68DRAFT_154859 [Aspergillus falconensis]
MLRTGKDLAHPPNSQRPIMYNCTIQYELHGPLDVAHFKAAMTTIAQRHEALRTAYIADQLMEL